MKVKCEIVARSSTLNMLVVTASTYKPVDAPYATFRRRDLAESIIVEIDYNIDKIDLSTNRCICERY